MKRLLSLLAALLLLVACAAQPEEECEWKVYFPQGDLLSGSALGWEPYGDGDETPTAEQLLRRLLKGPTDDSLSSPFPKGVSLRSWQVEDDVLSINLSEQYGGLSGIELTLADYSIALTLCQLPGVEGVSITVENDPIPFRYRQILTAEDVLLSDLLTDET